MASWREYIQTPTTDMTAMSEAVTSQAEVTPGGLGLRVVRFAGFDPAIGDGLSSHINLEWGSGSTWQSVRVGGLGAFEFALGNIFLTDGVSRMRIRRVNKSSSAKPIFAWVELLIDEL